MSAIKNLVEKILETKDYINQQYSNISKAKYAGAKKMFSLGILIAMEKIFPESKVFKPHDLAMFIFKFANTTDDEAVEMILQKEYQPILSVKDNDVEDIQNLRLDILLQV